MKCTECGSAVATSRENYRYTESGLPHVVLRNVEVRRCAECGNYDVVLPRIDELHQSIAVALTGKLGRLDGCEIRYLRKHLGWSGAELARRMFVDPSTVSRWEHGSQPIGRQSDALLRMYVATRAPSTQDLDTVLPSNGDAGPPLRLSLEKLRGKWQAQPIAATG